jgi:hypothetical protein
MARAFPFIAVLVASAAAVVLVGGSCRDRSIQRIVTESKTVTFRARSHANVFFVGHSLINFEMPKNMEVMAQSLGLELAWDAQIIDGAPLQTHVEHPERTQSMRVDEALVSGFYDTLVMTEAVPIEDMIRYREPARHAATLAKLARNGRSDTRIFLHESWMHRDRPRGSPFMRRLDWRAFLDEDLPKWERIADDASRDSAAPIAVLPAARALGRLVDAIQAGDVPGMEEGDLFTDHVHMTPLGNHYIAAVTLAAVFQRAPLGASGEVVDRHGHHVLTLPERTRDALYRLAWSAVVTYPRASTQPSSMSDSVRSASVTP